MENREWNARMLRLENAPNRANKDRIGHGSNPGEIATVRAMARNRSRATERSAKSQARDAQVLRGERVLARNVLPRETAAIAIRNVRHASRFPEWNANHEAPAIDLVLGNLNPDPDGSVHRRTATATRIGPDRVKARGCSERINIPVTSALAWRNVEGRRISDRMNFVQDRERLGPVRAQKTLLVSEEMALARLVPRLADVRNFSRKHDRVSSGS